MTARDDFDRHLTAWLDDRAPVREPEPLLGQVLARTARTRRRPAWLIPERWIPMSSISTRLAPSSRVPWRTLGVVVLLIVALAIGTIVLVGSRQPTLPPPFGVAANGALVFSVDGDLLVADAATSTPRTILGGSTFDNGPLYSPDGTQIAFIRGQIGTADAALWTAGADGTNPRMLLSTPYVGWAEWSPQSDTIAVLRDDSPGKIRLIAARDGAETVLDTHLEAVESVIWRPTDGARLTFRGRDRSGTWGLYLIDRTGGTPQRLDLDPGFATDQYYADNIDYYFQGPTWSPDGTRLLYYTLEPAPASPAGPGFRHHIATVAADGTVTDDRIVEYAAGTDDEYMGTWLGASDDILFQTMEGTENRLAVGSVAVSHGPARDLGLTANGWISFLVSPDTRTAIVTLPGANGDPSGVRSVDLASGSSTPVSLSGGDLNWQRVAPKS